MANIWGAIQSTITEAYKTANERAQAKWTEITATILNEGETTEKRLLDTGAVLIDPATGLPLETVPVSMDGLDLTFPTGDSALMKDKTIADLISGGKLKILNDVTKEPVVGTVVSGATDPNITFDQNATTEVTLADIAFASIANPTKEYILTVENTSAVTSVTITIKTVATSLNEGTKYNSLYQVTIPVSSSKSYIIRGILVGADVRFTATPDASITDANAANRKITMRLRNY